MAINGHTILVSDAAQLCWHRGLAKNIRLAGVFAYHHDPTALAG